MPRAQFMRENQSSKFTEILIWIFVFVMSCFAASNAIHGKVAHPFSFFIMIIGFTLFFISKLSVANAAAIVKCKDVKNYTVRLKQLIHPNGIWTATEIQIVE